MSAELELEPAPTWPEVGYRLIDNAVMLDLEGEFVEAGPVLEARTTFGGRAIAVLTVVPRSTTIDRSPVEVAGALDARLERAFADAILG